MDADDKARLIRMEDKLDKVIEKVIDHESKFKMFGWLAMFLVGIGTAIGTFIGKK